MKSFGPYEVLNLVAAGSTGTVYRARHTELDRVAAIKELSPAMRDLPGLLERLRAEAQLLGELDSAHVVAVYDYVEEPDSAWIAEEWVEGASLEAILIAHRKLTPEQSLGVLKGAMTGLACAHDRDVVHRDIAPTNILADMQGASKLVDFGLAAPVGHTGVCGTPAYVSPEAARGTPVGKSSDVYSAAAVLYTLLAGHPPFRAGDASGMLRSHMNEPVPSLPGHGEKLADLLSRAMAKDPAVRPPDASAFLAELEEAAQEQYGAGWWQRASIAGLVASTAAAGATAAALGGASGATVAGSPTVVTTAAATTGAAKVVRRGLSKVAVIATAAVVIVAAAGTAAAVALTRSSGDAVSEPIPPAVAKASASASAAAKVAKERRVSAPVGSYTLTEVVVASDIPGLPVGKEFTSQWTLALTCNPKGCTGSIADPPDTYFASFDGDKLVQDISPEPIFDEGPCVDLETGVVDPGTHYERETTYTATPLVVTKRDAGADGAPGVPTTLTGTIRQTQTITETSADCNTLPKYTATTKRTLTRTG